jgi:hemerythrin
MNLFIWGDDLNTDMALIDRQHKEYVRRTNAFLEASMERKEKGKGSARETFQFLRKYIDEHFTTEEELMAEYDYPARQRHIVQHRHFQTEVDQLGVTLDKGNPSTDIVLKLNYLLVDWFQRHIKQIDKQLTGFLAEQAGREGHGRLRDLIKGLLD